MFLEEGKKMVFQSKKIVNNIDNIEDIHFRGYPIGSKDLRYYLGCHPAWGGKTKFFNNDYDKHVDVQNPAKHVLRDIQLLKEFSIKPLISLSSSGNGYHLNMFLDKRCNSKDVFCFAIALRKWRIFNGEENPEVKPLNYGENKNAGMILFPRSGGQPFLNENLEPISDEEALLAVKEYSADVFVEASKRICEKIGVPWDNQSVCLSSHEVKESKIKRFIPERIYDDSSSFEALKKVFPNVGAYLEYKGYSIPEDTKVDCPFHSPINSGNTFSWKGVGCYCFSTRCALNRGISLFDLIKHVEGVDNVFRWAEENGLIPRTTKKDGYELAKKLNDFKSYYTGASIWKKN
jgi:hypothetical protein